MKRLIWNHDNGAHTARLDRGSRYVVYNTAPFFGYEEPIWAAHRKTRSGRGNIGLGNRATREEAKALCEQHCAKAHLKERKT